MDYVRQEMCGTEVLELTEEDRRSCRDKRKADDSVYIKKSKYSLVRKHRLKVSGTLEAHIELKNNIIGLINMVSDYFLLGDISTMISSAY